MFQVTVLRNGQKEVLALDAPAVLSDLLRLHGAPLSLPCGGTVPDAALCKELRALYKTMIPQPYYRGNVIFYGN